MRSIGVHLEFPPSDPTVEAAIAAIAAYRDSAVLDSADSAPNRGRYTILACNPIEVLTAWPGDSDPFETLRSRLACLGTAGALGSEIAVEHPFVGGWIGYFAYEAGHHIERIAGRPHADIPLPIARWGLYDSAAIHDAHTGTWSIVVADLRPVHPAAPSPHDRLAFWANLLRNCKASPRPAPPPPGEPIDNMSVADYLERVRRAREYIAAGDIFQVNIARRISVPQQEAPIETYLRLRRRNPAAYAAYLAWDDARSAILSASPELFLELHGRNVTTRPIKGTRPRSADPILDASYAEELLASEKDRAELAMIVDLERNDLGRVCDYGSIHLLPP